MSEKINNLLNIIDLMSSFYKENLGNLSNALWNAQDELQLTNSQVVALITALATAKEHVDNNIESIKESISGAGLNPE